MTILITGGTGTLGYALWDALKGRREEIRIFTRSGADYPRIKSIKGDVTDRAALLKASKGVDTFFHLAGIVSYTMPYEEQHRINVLGTQNAIEAAIKNKVKRFVHVSSVAALGKPQYYPTDDHHPCRPVNPYSRTKYESEKLVLENRNRIDLSVVRPSAIYGPKSKQFSDLIRAVYNGKLSAIGSGNKKFHIAYSKNVAHALLLCASRKEAIG